MAFAYAIFTLEEELNMDQQLQHIGCIEALSGATIEGDTSYQRLQVDGRSGWVVMVNDLQHDLDKMVVIIYDVIPTQTYLLQEQDRIVAMLSEVMVHIPPTQGAAKIEHTLMSRGNSRDRVALVYNYAYDRKRLSEEWAAGRRLGMKPVTPGTHL
jgi:hypothetical protein